MNAPVQRVVVLGSGAGTNFEALAAQAGEAYRIVAVGSDQRSAPILERARRHGIPIFVVSRSDYPDRPAHDRALAAALAAAGPDWIALAGYLRILGPPTVATHAGKILNIHPALLPAFPGLDTHRRALAAGVQTHGATVHFVTAALDAGPRIVQGRLAVHDDDSAESLRLRVQALEHRIYPLALGWCAGGRVAMRENKVWFDGQCLEEPIVIEERASCVEDC